MDSKNSVAERAATVGKHTMGEVARRWDKDGPKSDGDWKLKTQKESVRLHKGEREFPVMSKGAVVQMSTLLSSVCVPHSVQLQMTHFINNIIAETITNERAHHDAMMRELDVHVGDLSHILGKSCKAR